MALYYGCRDPDQDYIYKEELEAYVKEGVLTELNLAFSRITDKKVCMINQEAFTFNITLLYTYS